MNSVLTAFGFTIASCLIATLAALPLVWDGSQFLFTVLNEQRPLVGFHRAVDVILTAPVLLASWMTSDLAILRAVFSLTFAVVPLIALVASWTVVRGRRPDLFVWPMLGIGLALLPGRAAFAESLIAVQLSWPLLFAAVTGVDRKLGWLCAALGVTVALSHPVAAVLLLVVGAIGFVERHTAKRAAIVWLGGSIVLTALNAAVMWARLEPYEVESLGPAAALSQLARGAIGPQLAGLLLTGLGAWLTYRAAREHDPARRPRLHRRAAIAIALAAVPLLLWAAVADLWRYVIEFRGWALPITLPLFALAWADSRRRERATRSAIVEERMRISALASAVMLVVVLAQSVVWARLLANVQTAIGGRSGCVPAESVEGFPHSALGSWTIVPLSIVLQDRDVHAFVAPAELCGSSWPQEVPMVSFPALRPGWFRFR